MELIGPDCTVFGFGTADEKLQRAYCQFVSACRKCHIRNLLAMVEVLEHKQTKMQQIAYFPTAGNRGQFYQVTLALKLN